MKSIMSTSTAQLTKSPWKRSPAAVRRRSCSPALAAAPARRPHRLPAASGEGEAVNCPMPGTILSVNVNVGDTVTEGQILMILEAMKMENEIMALKAGKVLSVGVQKGATVESGTLLCVIG